MVSVYFTPFLSVTSMVTVEVALEATALKKCGQVSVMKLGVELAEALLQRGADRATMCSGS